MSIFNLKHPILFIGAHPDDVEINAGATVNKFISEGYDVYCVIVTNFHDNIRFGESQNALKCLGLSEDKIIHLKDFKDTELYGSLSGIIKDLNKIIIDNNIHTVFTHYPYDTHQDHVTVAQASIAAGRNISNIIYYSPTYPSGRTDIPFNTNLVIEVSEDNINKKVESLSNHKSQIAKYGNDDYLSVIKSICKSEAWKYAGVHGFVELFQISRIKV